MQIACPSCAATYDVPPARVKPGRSVRCSACGAEWKPAPEADPETPPGVAEPPAMVPAAQPAAQPAAPPTPGLTAMQRLAAGGLRPPRSMALPAAWMLTVLLLGASGVSTVVWRANIMRLWPPSSRILASFDRLPEKPAVISSKNSQ